MLPRLIDPSLPTEPLITAVTLAELLVGPLIASTDAERAARQAHLRQAEADFDPLPFDAPAARVFGRVAASLRRAGRKVNARAYDAMIAATALANGLPVYTCNPNDFAARRIRFPSSRARRPMAIKASRSRRRGDRRRPRARISWVKNASVSAQSGNFTIQP